MSAAIEKQANHIPYCNFPSTIASYNYQSKNHKMNSNKKTGRVIGVLFLLIFSMGVTMYQFLQSPLFADDFLTATSSSTDQIIVYALLGIISGATSVIIAILLLPIFIRHSVNLAYIYFAFCILYFVAIAIDNVSVLSLLELSKEYVNNGGENPDSFKIMGNSHFL